MMQDILLQTTWAEWLGVLFSMIQVVLASRNNSNNYLFGIAGISLTLYVMIVAKLYGEFTLNLYYLVMSIYGWLYWKYGKQKEETKISTTNGKEKLITVGIVSFTFGLFWFFLTHYTDSDVPIWDSLVSAFAWAGMWLMAKRKVENWILLNISNLISVPLMIHKDLYLYAGLTVFLFVVAVLGYIKWSRILKEQAYVKC
ncbi:MULTISPECIES: nicotinamide riboside transporter PnuC [Myroides]|jgi:nicotinamide mononucleotide transporter|uniref:Nicotinamide riboside transporter PnuC n=1 Tax=Myroides odoratus TaxID=256 RepID=A0A9Q6ZK00_MYROD|nr:nicotinamide riboside transporter PnuC [Myroides odoratus]EHQ40864.1 nicotinamide mononucleotide transporter PnuC [Myroides odoratus DSM 2801]EHQ44588.1 nicotinamide mononucleotide transporter PnuC [Myroides odoratus DSM 2801]EKB08162.1 nicotinamide mononucleotide transporter PnuC [Myroides odoratus CIP 103059]QQU01814.1 nicotinamide mononucleotide transporter [Myroides odoratus]WQD55900.1 nicotinamide riboside transporter PnuC [Myroides odoratus]